MNKSIIINARNWEAFKRLKVELRLGESMVIVLDLDLLPPVVIAQRSLFT